MNDYHNFRQQFGKREFLDSPYGKIEIEDVRPYKSTSSLPILFAPGWRETPELLKECMKEVYIKGRRVIALRHPVKLTKPRNIHGNYPLIEYQKADTLLRVIKYKKLKRVDAIAHSEGGVNLTIAASIRPDKFRNLVLVTPAGLMGKDSLFRLSLGFLQHLRELSGMKILHIKTLRSSQDEKNILKRFNTLVKECSAMTSYDIHPLLIRLKKHSIKIAVLAGEKDTVFPLEKVKRHLIKISQPPHYGFAYFGIKKGGHELYAKPKRNISRIFEVLNKL